MCHDGASVDDPKPSLSNGIEGHASALMVFDVLVEMSDNDLCKMTVPGYDQGVLDLKGDGCSLAHSPANSKKGILIDERV